VSLTRTEIVEAAFTTLQQRGLAGLSMRRLASDLGVQPGALYYHVGSKQDLLASVAARLFADWNDLQDGNDSQGGAPREAAIRLRSALLQVRDSAEVVSFVHAFQPDRLMPLRDMHVLFAEHLATPEAVWAAQTLIHYVLGFVAKEQNHAELVRAKILPPDAVAASHDAFLFGVDAILRGLTATARSKP
jgi:AcrR family transcriptional regulator